MVYKTRPGIELIHVCGTHLLIGTRATWDVCPHVMQLTRGAAFTWSLLAKGKSIDVITQVLSVFARRPIAEVREQLDALLEKFVASGYLLTDDSDVEYVHYE